MEFQLIQRKGRIHVECDTPGYDLVATFFLVEGTSFDDLISEAIDTFQTSGQPQEFSGNVHGLRIGRRTTTITDKLSLASCKLPTSQFIRIFHQWLDATYA